MQPVIIVTNLHCSKPPPRKEASCCRELGRRFQSLLPTPVFLWPLASCEAVASCVLDGCLPPQCAPDQIKITYNL